MRGRWMEMCIYTIYTYIYVYDIYTYMIYVDIRT